jgi:hypothetical protein
MTSVISQFVQNDWNVVALEILSAGTALAFRESLGSLRFPIVQLLPPFDELEHRFATRAASEGMERLPLDERHLLYDHQLALTDFDERINDPTRSAEDTADQLATLLTSI